MAFRTFGDLNDELMKELDLEGEEFIDAEELMRLWNRAVGVCEGHLITLGIKDKYLLGRDTIDIVQGQEAYDLPASIYGNKIMKMIYHVGATFYTMLPLESKDMFENYEYLNNYSTTDYYRYFILHNTPGEQKLILVPSARETLSGAIKIWFSRAANRYTQDSDICDLPTAAYEFLNAYVTEKVYKKESHVNYEEAKADRMEKEQLMMSVLSGQISDNELTLIEKDLSAYQESS
jgi:hypothetical protein